VTASIQVDLGLKPTLNQISKSVVGKKPTGENLERQNLPVNPVMPSFPIFLQDCCPL